MTQRAEVPFETIVELVDQLSFEQQQVLLQHLQTIHPMNGGGVGEKMARLRAVQVDIKVKQEPSPRREDWYDDDGR